MTVVVAAADEAAFAGEVFELGFGLAGVVWGDSSGTSVEVAAGGVGSAAGTPRVEYPAMAPVKVGEAVT